MRPLTFSFEIQCSTTFIWSIFGYNAYFWQCRAVKWIYFCATRTVFKKFRGTFEKSKNLNQKFTKFWICSRNGTFAIRIQLWAPTEMVVNTCLWIALLGFSHQNDSPDLSPHDYANFQNLSLHFSPGPFPRPPQEGWGVEHDTKRLCLICAFCTW